MVSPKVSAHISTKSARIPKGSVVLLTETDNFVLTRFAAFEIVLRKLEVLVSTSSQASYGHLEYTARMASKPFTS
jgi:hypothetical protein